MTMSSINLACMLASLGLLCASPDVRAAVSVSGKLYAADEKTPLTGQTHRVALRVNGGKARTTTTDPADGRWRFADVTAGAGDTITIYLAGGKKANVVTVTEAGVRSRASS